MGFVNELRTKKHVADVDDNNNDDKYIASNFAQFYLSASLGVDFVIFRILTSVLGDY